MHKPASLTFAAILLATSGAALAQSMAPGLWNIETKMGGNPELDKAMAQMQAQLASMPPAQRKQMEAIMGKSGVNIAASGAMAAKVCVTPEMATRQELPSQTQGDCTSKIVSRSAKLLKISFSCTNPVSSGEGTYTFESEKSYTVLMAIKTATNGATQNTTINGKGQWLAADCGNVKPIPLMAK